MSTNDTRQKLISMSHDLPTLANLKRIPDPRTLEEWQHTIAEAVKDSEMLDWLEARSWVEVRSIVNGRHMDASGMDDTVTGTNLREAITAAMQKEEEMSHE